jgi:ParB-like chromosome segregation protein Spo0J
MATDSLTPDAISAFSPLSDILRAPLRRETLEFDVGDGEFLQEFEKAWANFLRQNPELVPRGAREERIVELQNAAKKEEEAKLKVLKEMEQQVEFFKASCEALEDVYSGLSQYCELSTWSMTDAAGTHLFTHGV